MRKKRLLWQLYPIYLLTTLVSLLAVTVFASNLVRQFYLNNKISDLETRIRFIEDQISDHLNPLNLDKIDLISKSLGKKTATRITVILPDGKVIGDTEEEPLRMDNHIDRPEIFQASGGQTGSSTRYSSTVNKNMLYVALPLLDKGEQVGFVRVSVPITSIEQNIKSIQIRIALAGIIIAIIVAIISLITTRWVSRPLEEMKNGVEKFAGGDLSYRLPGSSTVEISKLTEALNQMAGQLEEKVNTIIRQKNKQETVFQSMAEGVIALDKEERLISINKAAAKLFNIDIEKAINRNIQEIIRNIKLQRFIGDTLRSSETTESEIIFWDQDKHFIQAHGNILKDEQEKTIGVLIVLNDVTRIRNLENMRKDFVANASHEIRTPLTTIKGFIETLLDGAIGDAEKAKHFLKIILKQTNRLGAIVEDLLSLARLEKEDETTENMLEDSILRNTLESALQACSSKASEKNIRLNLNCDLNIIARITPRLLEQAVINLVDNAIKHSDLKKEVNILAEKLDSKVIISVIDEGCGIEKEHLSRIFERFYRVDRARSRDLGGTGLGLAIVKHIAKLHKGDVTVESSPGQGSRFNVLLNA